MIQLELMSVENTEGSLISDSRKHELIAHVSSFINGYQIKPTKLTKEEYFQEFKTNITHICKDDVELGYINYLFMEG